MFESDCWLDWDPDPERAAMEADPKLEPYASMSKAEILELMASARGGREWERLQEYFLNKCTPEELAVGTKEFIKRQYVMFGFEELCFLEGAVDLALRRRTGPRADDRSHDAGPGEGRYPYTFPDRFNPVEPVPAWDKGR